MCVTFATPIVLMHINITILSAVRYRLLIQVSFHVHYLASFCDITPFEIHHTAWQIARSVIVLIKRFECENCNTKINVHSHLLWYIICITADILYRCQAIVDLIPPLIGLNYHFPHHHSVGREATKTASITWLLLSICFSAVRVMSMSRSLCLSSWGFSWWYIWTGDEGALSLSDQKTVEIRKPASVACLVTSSWGVQSTGDSFWSEDLP